MTARRAQITPQVSDGPGPDLFAARGARATVLRTNPAVRSDAAAGGPVGSESESLGDALEAQAERLRALHAISARQASVFASDDPAAILALVHEREAVMVGITELSGRVDDARAFLASGAAAVSVSEERGRERVEGLVRLIEALAQQIAARDAVDGAELVRRRDDLAQQLKGVKQSRSAVGAYSARREDLPVFQDRRG